MNEWAKEWWSFVLFCSSSPEDVFLSQVTFFKMHHNGSKTAPFQSVCKAWKCIFKNPIIIFLPAECAAIHLIFGSHRVRRWTVPTLSAGISIVRSVRLVNWTGAGREMNIYKINKPTKVWELPSRSCYASLCNRIASCRVQREDISGEVYLNLKLETFQRFSSLPPFLPS